MNSNDFGLTMAAESGYELPEADAWDGFDEGDFDGTCVDEDEDFLLDSTSDKPGMAKWVETLNSRRFSTLANACVGQWLPDERLVVLVQRRGKRFATMGFTRDGCAFLHPEEALWLLDQGHLYMLKEDAYWENEFEGGEEDVEVCNGDAPVGVLGGEEPVAEGGVCGTSSESPTKRRKTEEGRFVVAELDSRSTAESAPLVAETMGNEEVACGDMTVSCDDAARSPTPPHTINEDGEKEKVGTKPDTQGSTTISGIVPIAPPPLPAWLAASLTTSAADTTAKAGASHLPPSSSLLMPFEAAYMFLASYCAMDHVLVYSALRDAGFVVQRHRPVRLSAASAPTNPSKSLAPVAASLSEYSCALQKAVGQLGPTEPFLIPVYDVFARDGVTAFRPSAPGPPDFYVLAVRSFDVTPSPQQLADLAARCIAHSRAAQSLQAAKAKEKGKPPPASAYAPITPIVKVSIVSHTTVTMYGLGLVGLEPVGSARTRLTPQAQQRQVESGKGGRGARGGRGGGRGGRGWRGGRGGRGRGSWGGKHRGGKH